MCVMHCRYMLSVLVGDHTGAIWVSSFDSTARTLLAAEASQLAQWQADNAPQFQQCLDAAQLLYVCMN